MWSPPVVPYIYNYSSLKAIPLHLKMYGEYACFRSMKHGKWQNYFWICFLILIFYLYLPTHLGKRS